jgi:hypothetical protein
MEYTAVPDRYRATPFTTCVTPDRAGIICGARSSRPSDVVLILSGRPPGISSPKGRIWLENFPMTKEIAGASMTCAAILVSVGFLLSAEQSGAGRPTKGTEQEQTSKSTPDNWQKMKDCAVQAEKAVAERNRRSTSFEGNGSDWWSNHYSPKYNRCFLKAEFLVVGKDGVKGGPMFYASLIDAFEQVDLASSASGPSAQSLCRNEEDPKGCERGAAIVWSGACKIEGEQIDCAKARQFIDEHTKN